MRQASTRDSRCRSRDQAPCWLWLPAFANTCRATATSCHRPDTICHRLPQPDNKFRPMGQDNAAPTRRVRPLIMRGSQSRAISNTQDSGLPHQHNRRAINTPMSLGNRGCRRITPTHLSRTIASTDYHATGSMGITDRDHEQFEPNRGSHGDRKSRGRPAQQSRKLPPSATICHTAPMSIPYS